MRVRFICCAALLLAALRVHAAPPATAPVVPALITDSSGSPSFIADGILRFSGSGALAFHIASDGKRQLCAVFDPADGTPVFLSDGDQVLVYDLGNSRIVRVPQARAYVFVDWEGGKRKPMAFSFGAQHGTANELKKLNSYIRIDRFVSDSAKNLRQLDSPPGTVLFAAERADGKDENVEAIQQPATGADSFRFTSMRKGEDHYMLEMQVSDIGSPLPPQAFAYPNLAALRRNIAVADLDDQLLPVYAIMLRDGRAWMAKVGLSAGSDLQKQGDLMLDNPDWNELRHRDKDLGSKYRAALARQGIVLRPLDAPASTQPVR
jgi:hypothetical protein